MLVSQHSWHELRSQLNGAGLVIPTGPFLNRIKSDLPQVARGVQFLYADFPVLAGSPFVDFTVNVNYARGIHHWLVPRAYFLNRGDQLVPFGKFRPSLGPSFLEWGLNYSIYGKNNPYLTIHAAVLERDGCALLLIGDSGAGKSTLSAALALSGWRLLSDELALVDLTDDLVYPLARPVSLKNESIAVIQSQFRAAEISQGCMTRRKGLVAHLKPPSESVRQMNVAATPRWIVSVQHRDEAPLTSSILPRHRVFSKLLRSTFNFWHLGDVGFQRCCRLVDRCVGRTLQYSDLNQAVEHFDSPMYRV